MSQSGSRLLLGSATVAAVGIGPLVVSLPPPYPFVGVAAAVAAVACWFVPLRTLMFCWAALLPIWSLGPLPPVIFDAARFGLAMVIGLRAWTTTRGTPPNSILYRWITPLGVVALLMIIVAWWHGESTGPGLTMLTSVVTVGWALWRVRDVWPILFGFAAGVTVSAVVILASVLGVGAVHSLIPNQNPGYFRSTGLGTSAPRVSVELAVASIIWWSVLIGRTSPRFVTVGGTALTVSALLVSGGRTGLLGLGLAAVLLILRRWLRPAHAIAVSLALTGATYWLLQRDVSFSTLERMTSSIGSVVDLSTGRVERFATAWETFLGNPLFGTGMPSAHSAPLTFALAGGLAAGLIISVLSLRLSRLMFAGPGRATSALGRAGSMIAVVLVVTVLLEPTGPFLGVEMLTLLFAVVLATERAQKRVARLDQRSGVDQMLSATMSDPDAAGRL